MCINQHTGRSHCVLSATVVSGKAERELVGMCENFLLTTDGTQIERPVENWHLAMQHGKHQVTKAPSQPCKPPNPKSQATNVQTQSQTSDLCTSDIALNNVSMCVRALHAQEVCMQHSTHTRNCSRLCGRNSVRNSVGLSMRPEAMCLQK